MKNTVLACIFLIIMVMLIISYMMQFSIDENSELQYCQFKFHSFSKKGKRKSSP